MGYRYIGSKARIADTIVDYLGAPKCDGGRLIDSFSGTGIVACTAANRGWQVTINDMMRNALVMSEASLLSNNDVPFQALGGYKKVLNYLNDLDGEEGFFWKEYSPASASFIGIERKYFTEANAKKIDAIVRQIHGWKQEGTISDKEFSLLMSDSISAVNNVANIAGTYGCFLAKWTSQAENNLCLIPSVLRKEPANYIVSNRDVFEVASNPEDVVYLDPPYTKRQYASYYHILETMVIGDEPEVEGVAGLRPWKDKASVFCYKVKALKALTKLILQQNAHRVVVSYSNEGHVQLDELVEGLRDYGTVNIVEIGTIGRYRPNKKAVENESTVNEFLIDFMRK